MVLSDRSADPTDCGYWEEGEGKGLILSENRKTVGSNKNKNWDPKKSRAEFFEIVFIGPGPATMLILWVGVMTGDGRQEA